ncbi:MAG: ABC transporter ATP-binding protein [Candidatus Eremiobacteraeota bacterium]|nr:ABC transporter ATP-binding protein [Candidatus Eremiobacteraeota bacterium]MBV9646357.1 ABC transporter ATP-binding protein [Candidatus Eremiobacteraeota bacterium]
MKTQPADAERTSRLWARVLSFARPYWPAIAGAFLLNLMATPLSLLAPVPLKIAVDSVVGAHPAPLPLAAVMHVIAPGWPYGVLAASAVLLVLITLLMYLQGLGVWLVSTYLGERLVLEFRATLFRHAQRLSLSYHDRAGTTDSVYRIQYDAPCLQHILIDGIIPLATAAFTVIGIVSVTAWLSWQLAVVALIVCPVLYFTTVTFGKRLRGRWYEVKELDSSAMSVVQEALAAGRVVRAFGREEHENARFYRHSRDRMLGQVDIAWLQGRFDLAIGVTVAAGTAVVLFLGALQAKAGHLSIGELLIVMAYQAQIYDPLKAISKKMTDLQNALASAGRAFALLDELPDVAEKPQATRLHRARGEFVFDDVSFAYAPGHEVLRGIRLAVSAGSRVGIQGKTGSGKTTLVSLLARFYDPARGAIFLDGVDLRDYRLADLRNQFAIVLQETVLFSSSIRENIAYGKPDANDDEIVRAAKRANAHDFIESLPDGYATQVGERGMRLSGGERQRLSMARAFLKDAPILLLDEPTSALDFATEAAIVDAMERLMIGRTAFFIAHRATTLAGCNVRLEMRDGKLFPADFGAEHGAVAAGVP